MVEVLGIRVREDRDRRLEDHERAIRLVGFDDHVVALAKPRVRTETGELAADDDRRVESGVRHDRGNHRRRGGLPVRAANCDAVTEQPHELGEHLGARDDRRLAVASGDDLGVVLAHGRARHDEIGALDVLGAVPLDDASAERGQPLGDRRQLGVGPGDLYVAAEVQQDLGDAGHADAADADHVDSVDVAEHGVEVEFSRIRRGASHALQGTNQGTKAAGYGLASVTSCHFCCPTHTL